VLPRTTYQGRATEGTGFSNNATECTAKIKAPEFDRGASTWAAAPLQMVQAPRILVQKRQADASSQTELDVAKLEAKVKKLEQQLLAENEANDDLTEQLEQAYKANFKTRQENQARLEENNRLRAQL